MKQTLTAAEYRALVNQPATRKAHKFNAIPMELDGHKFPSKLEGKRYAELDRRQKAGLISNLQLQPVYRIVVNDMSICKYLADFSYYCHQEQQPVVEDAKGKDTPVSKIKRKLVKALYGIEVKLVTTPNQ